MRLRPPVCVCIYISNVSMLGGKGRVLTYLILRTAKGPSELCNPLYGDGGHTVYYIKYKASSKSGALKQSFFTKLSLLIQSINQSIKKKVLFFVVVDTINTIYI